MVPSWCCRTYREVAEAEEVKEAADVWWRWDQRTNDLLTAGHDAGDRGGEEGSKASRESWRNDMSVIASNQG